MKDNIITTPATSGRPTISEIKKRHMRREIADVAKRLFQAEGYVKISIRRIAAEIGCSPMTLYKYYGAKVDILRTLWGDVFSELFDQLEAMPDQSENRLQGLCEIYVRYWLANPDYYRLVFIADGVAQSDVSAFIDSPDLVQRFDIFAQAFALQCGESVDTVNMQVKLDALICFLNGIAHNLITISGYGWSDPDEMVAMAVRAVTD